MPLGRGLSSLIPNLKNQINFSRNIKIEAKQGETAKNPKKEGELWHIPISLVKANAYQPRKVFDHQGLEDLINSIKEHGVIQPLLVTEKEDGTYELIAGERRWRAAKIVGLTTVPAVIKNVSGSEKLELALIENIQRQNLNPLEESFAFERLVKEFNLTQEEVGKRVGKSRSFIGNSLRLLSLPEEIQKGLTDGLISSTAARAILGLENNRDQLNMYHQLLKERASVHSVEEAVASKRWQKKGITRRDPLIVDYEQKIRETLGTKIKITKKGEKGTIVIDYYSEEELKRLIREIIKK